GQHAIGRFFLRRIGRVLARLGHQPLAGMGAWRALFLTRRAHRQRSGRLRWRRHHLDLLLLLGRFLPRRGAWLAVARLALLLDSRVILGGVLGLVRRLFLARLGDV